MTDDGVDSTDGDTAEATADTAAGQRAPEGRSGDFVQSLERGLAVIRAFDAEHAEMTLSDVARATGLTRAAARRFLHTLVALKYMRTDGRLFALRPRVLELGYAYLSSMSLPEVAMPHLEELVGSVHESSSVSVLDGDEVVYVARVPTKRIMTVGINVGTRFPAHVTSMGRVLLAAHTDDWLQGYLSSVRLQPLTERTITDRVVLLAELQHIRAQGWTMVDQELEPGLRSLAAPIHDPSGTVVAAVNVSAPATRGSMDRIREELLPPLLDCARRIEEDLRAGQPGGSSRARNA